MKPIRPDYQPGMLSSHQFRSFLLLLCIGILLLSCAGEDGADDDSSLLDGDTESTVEDGDSSLDEDGDLDGEDETPLLDGDEQDEWEIPEEFEGIDPSLCMPETPLEDLPFDPQYLRLESGLAIMDKNVYLSTVLLKDEDLNQAQQSEDSLNALVEERAEALAQATCGEDLNCWDGALTWSEEDIAGAVAALTAWNQADLLISRHLLPCGDFARYANLPRDEFLQTVVSGTLEALNRIWLRYSRRISTADLLTLLTPLQTEMQQATTFTQPLARVNEALMQAQGRDEAVRYDPLTDGENRLAFERMETISWSAYPFSVMMVPGQGPNDLDTALHPTGAGRCDLAAERFKAGLAPFILVSGGHVHPDQTPYCEAIEMKAYLMETHGIAENAILIDPYARHTTTNARNLGRTILRYGFPPDKPAMTNTDLFQSAYMLGMEGRLLDELGYIPYRRLVKMTDNNNCLLTSPDALTIDPSDPLDP